MSKIFLVFFFLHGIVHANEIPVYGEDYTFVEPHPGHAVSNVPRTLVRAWNFSFNTKAETLWTWGGVLSSSVLLYVYDEQIYRETQRMGRRIGLGNDDHTKSYIDIGGVNIFQGPSDVGSSLYYIGNGWVQFSLASGFYLTGKINDDNRAQQTGVQILTALFSGSIPTQLIKRATGRQDPYRTFSGRGKWQFFDSGYDRDISNHDAVPSGHLMAFTSAFTVIDTNYPEYHYLIRPIGFGLMGLLAFQMVNIGVHWASDYPLGAAIGYVAGRSAAMNGRVDHKKISKNSPVKSWSVDPIFFGSENRRTYGLIGTATF